MYTDDSIKVKLEIMLQKITHLKITKPQAAFLITNIIKLSFKRKLLLLYFVINERDCLCSCVSGIYKQFSIQSHVNLGLVIPNNKLLEH